MANSVPSNEIPELNPEKTPVEEVSGAAERSQLMQKLGNMPTNLLKAAADTAEQLERGTINKEEIEDKTSLKLSLLQDQIQKEKPAQAA